MTVLSLVVALSVVSAPAAPRTLRVDAFHSGNVKQESYSLDRIVLEPLAWPGPLSRVIDDTNLGKYRFEVRDAKGGRVLYSRGYASIFGEWETTGEARKALRTFHESLRFPRPDAPVKVVIQKRDAHQTFRDSWTFDVDPRSQDVDDSVPVSPGKVLPLLKNGDPATHVDLLLLGDGYTAKECGLFEAQARKRLSALFALSPFKERKRDFNVWGICPPSEVTGVSRPSTGIHRRSRIGATYDTFGSERYILSFENRALRDVASFAPHEFVVILAKSQVYGGGGIFNLYSTVAADSKWADYLFVHELGHHFAALADEYYTSESAYAPDVGRAEPWEPNVTAATTRASSKWKDLMMEATPTPTPWEKPGYENHMAVVQAKRKALRAANRPEAEMDALFVEQQQWETAFMNMQSHQDEVGLFEGAHYEAKGFYRPEVDCVMFSRNPVPFCRVCQRALHRIIDLHAPH